jgi:hypothetical protein
MPRISARTRRQALFGWIKWIPVLFVLFSALFLDAWLTIRSRRDDYAFRQLMLEERELRKSLEQLRRQSAELGNLDRLDEEAVVLEMVKPEQHQLQTVYYAPPQEGADLGPASFSMALKVTAQGLQPNTE